MMGLRCHIFPRIDDGAKNLTDSILIANQAVEDGIATIVATLPLP